MNPAMVMDPRLQQRSQQKNCATLECPRSMVGRVIGKNGETIKALQTFTGSLIQVNQVESPCQITISGTPQSLSLAVSMCLDIVKGTFKGFALLRQVASPGGGAFARGGVAGPNSYPFSQQQQSMLPQPVYAPGYGLIPPSQLYGTEDRIMPSSLSTNSLPPGFNWSSTSQVDPRSMLGLQSVSQRSFNTSSMLNGNGSALSMQPAVFSSVPMNGTYGGLYYPNADLGSMDALNSVYSSTDGGSVYAASVPPVLQSSTSLPTNYSPPSSVSAAVGLQQSDAAANGSNGGGVPTASAAIPIGTNSAQLIQATAGHNSHLQQLNQRGSGWLPSPRSGAQPVLPVGSGFGSGSPNMNDLLEASVAAAGQSGVGVAGSGGGGGGNLVMDADGKVYYVNALQ